MSLHKGIVYRIRYRGRDASIGGTSASSPTFAGFVALLNDARIGVNKPPLGFLNPLLYTFGIAGPERYHRWKQSWVRDKWIQCLYNGFPLYHIVY